MNCNMTDFSNIMTTFRFDNEAKDLITALDTYTNNLTQYDLDARCHKQGATLNDYLELCKKSVKDFSEEETYELSTDMYEVDSELKRHGMQIPDIEDINIVRTSGEEENDTCAYTRGNTIFLCDKAFAQGGGFLERVFVHELFHILSRNCPEFKKEMYSIIGYTVTDKTYAYPEAFGNFISNPDTPNQICYAPYTIKGKEYNLVTMMFTHFNWGEGQDFNSMLHPYFFPVDENGEFIHRPDGQIVKFNYPQCCTSYLDKVGRNSHYLLNPEEVLAENFVYAVLGTTLDLPNWEIISDMRNIAHAA